MSNQYYAKRTNWYAVKATTPNISNYIYNDVNRNGLYDIEDLPMMKVVVKMTRPDGTTVARRSNLNGFANFTHSLTEEKVDVKATGTYKFEVIVPEGWEITSYNGIQHGTYSAAPHARPGIIIDKVPDPVGIAPILTISGEVYIKQDDGSIKRGNSDLVTIHAQHSNGEIKQLELTNEGKYSFVGNPGSWTINYKAKNGKSVVKRVMELNRCPIKVSSIVLGEEDRTEKNIKNTVDFAGITYSEIQKMPNGVGGLNWSNLVVTHNKLYKGEGYSNGTISGEYVGYNSSGHPVTIELAEGFDFYGAYFTAAWLEQSEGETLEVRAWRGEELVVDEEYTLSALGPFWLDANYKDITKLVLSTKHYWQFIVDHIHVGI
ncbi:hypothetical protein [Solibacillus sp. FSL K6-1554]|uniref:hypothetical protein n=1 Tax=Solibacillus sp. FSL K6-1554 TaxID=2921472 RepID=UPI0030FAC11D